MEKARVLKMDENPVVEKSKYIAKYEETIKNSPMIIKVISTIQMALEMNLNIFIHGETGVGKTIIAKLAVLKQGKNIPFVDVNIGAIPDELFESSLFGHKKGAFTSAVCDCDGYFAKANGGVLFLDEIADLSPVCQAKLLSAIESGSITRVGDTAKREMDISFIFASNKDIANLPENLFRRDLYYRISAITVYIPSLRERRGEIDLLLNYFLRKLNEKFKDKPDKVFGVDTLTFLNTYDWPGNLREMKNAVSSAFIMAGEKQKIEYHHLHPRFSAIQKPPARSEQEENCSSATVLLDNEKKLIIKALEEARWSQKVAAESLGITPRVLNYKIKKFGITHPNWRVHNILKNKELVIKDDQPISCKKKRKYKDKEFVFRKEYLNQFDPDVVELLLILKQHNFSQRLMSKELGVPRSIVRTALQRNNIQIEDLKSNLEPK